jgi:3-oxoacyl-[acyl-carrier-protein] synthase-1
MNTLMACMCLEEGFTPPSLNTHTVDPDFGSRIMLKPEQRSLRTVLSNAFGFGGSNASLLLGWPDERRR